VVEGMKVTVPKVDLIAYTPDPNKVIETALLQCQESYDNIEKKRKNLKFSKRIENIFKFGHLGVLEHASATFQITGISRVFSHQLVRHRVASYAQMSQRVVPVEKMGYIVPPSINSDALKLYVATIDACESSYKILIEKYGIPSEDARFLLPNATETQLVVTMDFRSWLHFLKLRLDKTAQWEIRQVAQMIYQQLKVISPEVFDEKYKEYWE
jgi:thymidylate synthase (FAD)